MPDAFERWVVGQGREIEAVAEKELSQGLVEPDFFDVACRVQRAEPGYWSEAQFETLRAMPASRLPGQTAVHLASRADEGFDRDFLRLFDAIRKEAEFEAQITKPRHRDSVGAEIQPWWRRWFEALGLNQPVFVWGAGAAASLFLVWNLLPQAAQLSLRDLANGNTLAEYLAQGSSDYTVAVPKQSPRTQLVSPGVGAPVAERVNEGLGLRAPAEKFKVVIAKHPPSQEKGAAKKSRKMSLEDLEKAASKAWKQGEYERAMSLYRKIIARAPKSKAADVAWGDLFLLLSKHGDAQSRRRAWTKYRESFPKGRFAEHAEAGLCRSMGQEESGPCWEVYLTRYPDGVFADEAKRAN